MTSPSSEPPPSSIRSYAVIWGQRCDPDAITRRIGVTPTKRWRVGDMRHEATGRRHTDAGWRMDASPETDATLEAHVEALLEKLWPARDQLRELRTVCEVQFTIVIHCRDAAPAMYLSAATIERLAAIGAALDIDLYRGGQ